MNETRSCCSVFKYKNLTLRKFRLWGDENIRLFVYTTVLCISSENMFNYFWC